RFRDDTDAGTFPRHAADSVETAQRHPNLELRAEPCRLNIEVILQGAAGEPDKMLVEKVNETNLGRCRQRVFTRRHHNEPVDGEGPQYQAIGFDGAGKYADLGKASRDAFGDFDTLPFLQFDVGLWMRRHPWRKPRGQKLG